MPNFFVVGAQKAGTTSLIPNWNLDSSLQYDPDLSRTVRSVLGVRYAPGPFRTLSATYRFARSASEQFEAAFKNFGEKRAFLRGFAAQTFAFGGAGG